MDKTLERIVSLIPKKENGDFKHGALKEFANSIGLKSGNLISDWIAGRSVSYNSYVYEIAAKYNVSIEWLKGETDEKGIKKQPAEGELILPSDLSEDKLWIINKILNCDEKELKRIKTIYAAMIDE